MRLYLAISLAVLALFVQKHNAALPTNCPKDIVFIVDASTASASSNLYSGFATVLRDFVNQNGVNDLNIRVGAVFLIGNQVIDIPISGIRSNLGSRIDSYANLPANGPLNIVSGLNRANDLFRASPRTAQKVAVVIAAGRSTSTSGQSLALSNLRSAGVTIFTVGVSSTIVQYDQTELRNIGTFSSINVPNASIRRSELLSELERIATSGCVTITNPSVCDECEMENGVGYLPYTGSSGIDNARYYIQCKREDFGSGVIAYQQRCPDGGFWNNRLKNCVDLVNSDFYTGQCDAGRSFLFASYACGAYFNCTDLQIAISCCPDNTAFDEIQNRCVPTALEQCPFHCSDPELSRASAPCDKTPFRMANNQVDPCRYYVIEGVNGEFRTEQSCAQGTHFNQTSCNCNIFNDTCLTPEIDVCQPDFNLEYNSVSNTFRDTARGSWIENKEGVTPQSGSASFSGLNQQRLSVARYTNNDLGLPVAIKIRYQETRSGDRMAVIATGDCLSDPGLYVLVGNNRVTLGVRTQSTGSATTYETTTTSGVPGINQWKEVVFFYDGFKLQGEVRVGSSVIPIPEKVVSTVDPDRILMVPGALSIGYVKGLPAFNGLVDRVTLWKGCPTKSGPSNY